jgi:hypothetical protein
MFMLALVLLKTLTYNGAKAKLGVNAVKMLYQFRNVDALEYQQESLKSITTEDVYNQLTVDNDQRMLNTYLKFNEDASSVNVEKSTDSYVIYSLDCDSIDESRKFVFLFDVNSSGKISYVRECELIDFIAGD